MSTTIRETSRESAEPILHQVTAIVALLQKAVKIVCLYPPSNPSCAKAVSLFSEEIRQFLQTKEQLPLTLADDGFLYEGNSVEPVFGDSHRLSKMCYDSGVSELVFSKEFSDESARELLEIFRRVITKDEGDIELGEALWGISIAGFQYEIIEDLSYLEFDSELRREFFSNQGEGAPTGYLSGDEDARRAYTSTFDDPAGFDDPEYSGGLSPEQKTRFDALVTTLADDTPESARKAVEEDESVHPRELLMRVYELDSKESHATAMALARDSLFNPDNELLNIINDLFEQDKLLTGFSDTVLTCIKAHSHFIEQGSLKPATAILQKLVQRRHELHETAPNWEAKVSDALSSIASRERLGAVSEILNADEDISAADFSHYLSAFDWTAYSTLIEMLGGLEHKAHRLALCEFLSAAKEEHIDLIASGLYDKRWYVARNTAIILSNFHSSRSHRHLQKAMQHSEPRVRIEIVHGCQKHDSVFATSILLSALEDEDAGVSQLAVKIALSQTGAESFVLFEALLDKLIAGRLPDSLGQSVLVGYSQAGQSHAVEKLAKIGGDWKIIGHSHYQRFRERAIFALQINLSDESERALRNLSRSWCKEIKLLAQSALEKQAKNREERG